MYSYFLGINFLNGLVVSILGFFVVFKNRRNIINRTFFLMQIAAALWAFGFFIWGLQKTETGLLFWGRFFCLAASFIPIFYLHWILALLGKIRENKIILVIGYLVTLLIAFLSYSPFYIKGLVKIFSFYPPGPLAGPLYSLTTIFEYFILLGYAYFQLFFNYFKSTGYRRAQIKYVTLGAGLGFIGGMVYFAPMYNLHLPIILYILTSPFVILYTSIYTYAITKYRLMDIRLIIKRTVIFSVVVFLITIVYVLATFLISSLIFGKYLGADGLKPMLLAGVLVSFLIALGIRPLYEFLEKITDRYFFKGEYQPQELIRTISEKLITSLEINKIQKILTEEIVKAMKLEGANFFVLETSMKDLPIKNLIHYLNQQKEILVVQEMKLQYQDGFKKDERYLAYKDLEQTPAAVVVPIYEKPEFENHKLGSGELSGLLILKGKKSGDAFTNQDIQTLEIIASQASIALENAKMYEKIKHLLETKTQIISIVSHQIKNPLAIIKGLASLINSDIYQEKNNLKEVALKIKQTTDKIFMMINNVLDIQKIESGALQYDFKKIDLRKIVEEAVEKSQVLAKEKGLKLDFKTENKGIFAIADEIKIYQCALNLLDNAIKFTDKGFIKVKLFTQDGWAILEIEDTGRGIKKDVLPKLFNKFERGGEEVLSGFGLGLYIAKIFIDAHQGEIWAESGGEGKGSKFFIKLKLAE